MFETCYYRYYTIIDTRYQDRNYVPEFRTLQIRVNALQKRHKRNDEFARSVIGKTANLH